MNRLFVAIDLPELLKDRLDSLCNGVPDAHWISPENRHLTLAFIGDVAASDGDRIKESLNDVWGTPFTLRVNRVDAFAGHRQPTVLWAGLEDSDDLDILEREVRRSIHDAGVRTDEKRFRPHITLGRMPAHLDLTDFLDQNFHSENFFDMQFDVKGFQLFSSQLLRDGARYRVEEDYPFGSSR